MTSYARAARRLLALTAIASACNSSTSFVAAAAAAGESDPSGSGIFRDELNWEELESKLSAAAALINTSFTNYRDECVPEFYEESPTNHALIDQPSGMCLPHLLFGWEVDSWVSQIGSAQMKPLDTVMSFESDDNDTTPSPIAVDESNRGLNLPYKVVFPANASDVYHIILFAMKNNIEISVKNSGHSYSGSSSKSNTLLLNMNRFTQYASGGITECDAALLDTEVADDLSNQACLLALSRGKPGVIRVGGGENYDKAYGAVLAENQAQDAYKYHLVGGHAGTVSPMGWTFQGGNAGTAGGRVYGMGVDQVLQVEMVLPNGSHVKFGPTEWEDASAEGFVVPRTTVVSGVCRSNPDEQDEEKWMWGACPDDFGIDFGDLWFAVNGGGGGTWGVVTSLSVQLQDFLPYNEFELSSSEECSAIVPKFNEFRAKYFMRPALLNVMKERSLACGTADVSHLIYCYGEEDVMPAWTNFLELNKSTDYATCLEHTVDSSSDESLKSFPESVLARANARFPGKVPDSPLPSLLTTPPGSANVLVPQAWIDESEENIDTLLKYSSGYPYYAYGAATYSFSDQANSLPQSAREAATMSGLALSMKLGFGDDFWSELFPQMYDISDKTNFPAVYQSNHAGPSAHGPLKDDWTKACPLEWTFEERKEKCISAQEAIYGTEVLRRLEAIKMKVDPGFMFDCHGCIGNNLDAAKAEAKEPEAEVPLDEPSSVAVDEPSGASVASTSAAAISATVLYLFFSLF